LIILFSLCYFFSMILPMYSSILSISVRFLLCDLDFPSKSYYLPIFDIYKCLSLFTSFKAKAYSWFNPESFAYGLTNFASRDYWRSILDWAKSKAYFFSNFYCIYCFFSIYGSTVSLKIVGVSGLLYSPMAYFSYWLYIARDLYY
jgi:hypothetical protein